MPINLFEAFDAACRRHRDVPFDKLSEADRVLISVWTLESDVNNGGFHQYYFNSAGDTAHYAPTALRGIGAGAMADIVDRANSRFGPSGPPISRDERQETLDTLPNQHELWADLEQQFFAYPDNVSMLLEGFLEAHANRPHSQSE